MIDIPAGATVAQYVQKRWGRAVRTVPLQSWAILTTPLLIAKGHPRRFQLQIHNMGTGNVYVLNDGTVSVTNGFLVSPLGGSIIIGADEDGELPTYPWYAVAAAAGNTVITLEIETL